MNSSVLNGFLNLHKPVGPTSNDLVEEIRRLLGTNCGHAGTLDPRAEGVLVLGIGETRKFIHYLDHRKAYEGVVLLGRESATLDMEGELSEPRPVNCTPEEAGKAGKSLIGTIELPVPAFSAVHVDGKRLYALAREGKSVTPPLRKCTVASREIIEVTLPRIRFRVECSGGTYIRSLASEWGRRLGCGGLLESLLRIRSGNFTIETSIPVGEVRRAVAQGQAESLLIPPAQALAHIPSAAFPAESARLLRHGRPVPIPPGGNAAAGGNLIILSEGGFLGIAGVENNPAGPGLLALPERLLAEVAS